MKPGQDIKEGSADAEPFIRSPLRHPARGGILFQIRTEVQLLAGLSMVVPEAKQQI